jgi:alkylation response protein AidB-like acyl-CoA dehydrogenase
MTAGAWPASRSRVAELDGRLSELEAFSPARCADLDRREAFPADACLALDDLRLHLHYVPVRHGGRLASYEELLLLLRTVARRDLTVAVAHGKTFLGAVSVWVAGDPDQAGRLGADVADGAIVAWGLSERDHGSDLLAGRVAAARTGRGWRLNGEKWPVNNATRGHVVCVLARTDPAGGPRGFSLLLADKRALPAHGFRCLPKEPTHGIRGADISGIAFTGAELPDGALVGRPGEGVDAVLRALQVTRTICASLSLGAADRALELALDFAATRALYDRRLADLPPVRRTLGEAAATLLLAEALSVVASRAVHALPAEMSVLSAAVKSLVPALVDELIGRLRDLLGLRAFLAAEHAHGAFQKLERDHRIVAIFDGTTFVNMSALINQFPRLARGYRDGGWDERGLAAAATLEAPLEEAELGRLSLVSRGPCSLLQALPQTVEQLRGLPAWPAARALREAAGALHGELAGYRPSPAPAPAGAYRLARRYELCLAGAACVQLWLRTAPSRSGEWLWRDGLWLEACVARVLALLGRDAGGAVHDELAGQVLARRGERLSLLR